MAADGQEEALLLQINVWRWQSGRRRSMFPQRSAWVVLLRDKTRYRSHRVAAGRDGTARIVLVELTYTEPPGETRTGRTTAMHERGRDRCRSAAASLGHGSSASCSALQEVRHQALHRPPGSGCTPEAATISRALRGSVRVSGNCRRAVPFRGRREPWIQALTAPQPKGCQLKKGRCGTITHDKRNGTTTLFAALDDRKAT